MKIIKIIGLFTLFSLSFFFTEKVINVAMNQDEIMIKIKEYEKNYNGMKSTFQDTFVRPEGFFKEV